MPKLRPEFAGASLATASDSRFRFYTGALIP
jgi:hypothetical protein